jgi:hypothetical protein
MPEIKKQFTGGKMNKDVDERLVPTGEYRDAMNVQVSTSEGSDVGTIQNILGNMHGCDADNNSAIGDDAFTVGSISDEKNDTLYWLISGNSYNPESVFDNNSSWNSGVAMKDFIWQYSSVDGCKPVFVDKYGFSYENPNLPNTFNSNILSGIPIEAYEEMQVGWTVIGVTDDGTVSNTATITGIAEPQGYYVEYAFTPQTNPSVTTTYIGPNGMAVGSGILIPMNDFSFQSPGSSNPPNWTQSTGNIVYITDFSSNVSGLVGDKITILPYNTTNSQTFTIDAAVSTNVMFAGGYGSNVVKLTLSANLALFSPALPNLPGALLQDGTGVAGFYNGSVINALIASSGMSTNNIATGELMVQGYDVSNFTVGDQIYFNGGQQQAPGYYCINSIDTSGNNNSIYLADCTTGTVISGWQVGGSIYGVPQPFGGGIIIPADNDITLDQNLDLTTNAYTAIYLTGPRVLNFNHNELITGINIIDDMLFWTDGRTEPKRINIPRSILGTDSSANFHTRLINPDQSIGYSDNVMVKEEHISVIKKSPLSAPRLSLLGRKDGESYGKVSHNFSTVSFGDSINIGIDAFVSGASLNYEIGDILLLKQIDNPVQADFPVTDFDIRLVITGISGTGNSTVFSCEALSIGAFNVIAGIQTFASDLDNYYEKLYHLKFPRFAYRYKYSDKEYSVIGPFSEVAFKPSPFDFSPQKASNLGMENSLRYLAIEHLIPQNLPKDVVQVDLLYKDSSSPNVYLVDEIKPQNTAWILNKYNITKETIKGAIQSNQLLRSWDNVPKKALAQELSGNRIIYGNFFQNYSLEDYVVKLNAVLIPRVLSDNSYLKSIKSLRDYQVGIVYSDAYGRQSPVLTSPDSSIKVGKLDATKNTQIELVSSAVPPTWAKYQKFYIKETSTEYYNLSLDRYFDAEDGNLWLSFPSSDRNKLTLEDSLYLKKAYLSAEGGFNSEKYKVIDIQNEAPEFIRTRRTILGKINNHAGWIENVSSQAENNILFLHANKLPCRYEDEFHVNLLTLKNTILENFHKRHNSPDSDDATIGGGGGPMVNNPIFIRISSVISDGVSGHLPGPYKTDWYEVDNVSKSLTGDGYYIVRLKKPFGVDAVFTNTGDVNVVDDMAGYLTTGPTGSNVAEPYSLVFEVGQDIVQNKSIFQGRFFVKVFRDAALQESIVAPQITTNVQILKTARVGYLKDFTQEDLGMTASAPVYGSYGISGGSITAAEHAAQVSNFNTNGPTGNPGNLSSPIPDGVPIPTDAYCSWRAWHRIMEKLNSLESRWVIDEAYAAGEEPFYGMAYYLDYNETNINAGGTSTIYGGYNKESANFWTLEHNANSGNYTPAGMFNLTGLGHGQNFKDYEYFTIGKGLTDFTIDLSYIGVGRTENGTPDADSIFENLSATAADQINVSQTANTQWISWWVISDGNNIGDALDQEARLFADYLIEDTRIRFTDDPNLVIYKITQVKKIYKYNYAEGVDDRNYVMASNQIGDEQSYGGAKHYYNRAHFNRRLTYRLTLQAEIANLPIGTNLMGGIGYNPLDGTDISGNFCNIEIVTANVVNEDNPLPEDPAVFETVPNNEDIDIYHECSDTIPLDLRFNAEAFAPVGSLVSCQDNSNGLNILYGEPRVLLWESGNILRVSGGYFIGANQTSNDLLTFTRPDGSYTTAMLNSVEKPFISGSGTAYNSYYASIQPIVSDKKVGIGWHNCYAFGNGVESDRIRDTYNSATIDNGPRVSTTFEDGYEEEHRKYGLIYSGLYNSNSGMNNLNQFIQAEKITKDLNPTYGSIQKLHAGWGQGGDLIALCEDRVLKILANKDALYNADGNSNITSTNNVLGTATPFAGNYGISKNPESFASESFRAYFTDKVRGAVIRLSMDGLTAISDHGMKDWFRDNLKLANRVIGSYDDRNDEYVLKLDYSYVPQSVNLITPGCMDPLAMNYNALANSDDSSCTYAINGCTNPLAFNYNSSATVDDYSCITYNV